jgi:Cft2 family RNA processing exonuclease
MGARDQSIGCHTGVSVRLPTLKPISGLGAKGPACFLVETDGARLLLDLGYGPQPGLWPDVSSIGRVDALLLSHGHRDHAGALELLPQLGDPPVYATEIVRRRLPGHVRSFALPLTGSTDVCGIRVRTGRNGHAPGGVWLHVEAADGLLYTGDISVESAVYAYDAPASARTVLLDASYGVYDKALTDAVKTFDTIFDTGPVLLPVPPAGRAPDIALYLVRSGHGLPHVDSAVRSALAELAGEARACLRPDAAADLASIAEDAPPIDGARGVMLAAVADGTSGDAARWIERWEDETLPAIVFTGYIPPDTPAERLTQSGRGRYVRWNVHPRLGDCINLVRGTGARTVLPAFGDARHLDAWRSAFAPASVHLSGPVAL